MADFYELFKWLHVLSAMVWFGGGVFTQYVAARLLKADKPVAVSYAETAVAAGNGYFAKAAVSTLIFGVLTVIAGDLSFGEAWIGIGFAGIFISIFTGAVLIGKATEAVLEATQTQGVESPDAVAARAKLRMISAIDSVVLIVVIAAMVFKPGA